MSKLLRILFALAALQLVPSQVSRGADRIEPAANLIDWEHDPPQGALVIIGGALRFDDPPVWKEITALALTCADKEEKVERPRIVVLAMASGNPQRAGERHIKALANFGADATLAPLAAPGQTPLAKGVEAEPAHTAVLIDKAHGVFFTGGEQARILAALRNKDGSPNEALRSIIKLYRRGGVIAGTSAGAAVMSRIAYRDAEFVLPTLTGGVTLGKEIDHGLGVMRPDWFIDQHCLVRGRFARSLVVMQKQGFKYGLGIDENTALVIQDAEVRIVGYSGAILLDASAAAEDTKEPRFNWKNVKLTYLDRGDRLNLTTRAVTPATEKIAGEKVDPNAAGFDPYYKVPLFSNDVLGNTTLIDMMHRLLETKDNEGIGLAFDGHAARRGPTPGFEFKLYRGPDTHAWSTGAFGGEASTVLNVYLDIRPIVVEGPLYK